MAQSLQQETTYEEIQEKTVEILHALANDGWSARATGYLNLDAATDNNIENYRETGLLEEESKTELGIKIEHALNNYAKQQRDGKAYYGTEATQSGIGVGSIGYRRVYTPEMADQFAENVEEAGEKIGLITNKRGDKRRYKLFTQIAGAEPIPQSQLNNEIEMARGPLSRILGELEEENLVRKYSPTGTNGNMVELTEEGEELEMFVNDVESSVEQVLEP